MSEPAEIILALPGDVILCWDCGAEVAVFRDGVYRTDNGRSVWIDLLPAGREIIRHNGRRFICRLCGGKAGAKGVSRAGGRVEDDPAPSMLVRSGSWTGWRALGGE